jgi:hypothetical protein
MTSTVGLVAVTVFRLTVVDRDVRRLVAADLDPAGLAKPLQRSSLGTEVV